MLARIITIHDILTGFSNGSVINAINGESTVIIYRDGINNQIP